MLDLCELILTLLFVCLKFKFLVYVKIFSFLKPTFHPTNLQFNL